MLQPLGPREDAGARLLSAAGARRSIIGSSIYGSNNNSGRSPGTPASRRQGSRSKWIMEPEQNAGGALTTAASVQQQQQQSAMAGPVGSSGFAERLKLVRSPAPVWVWSVLQLSDVW